LIILIKYQCFFIQKYNILLVLFSPGGAETDIGCGGKLKRSFDGQLYQKYSCQILLKFGNFSLSYNQKCPECFFRTLTHSLTCHSVLCGTLRRCDVSVTGPAIPETIPSPCCAIPFTLNGEVYYNCTRRRACGSSSSSRRRRRCCCCSFECINSTRLFQVVDRLVAAATVL